MYYQGKLYKVVIFDVDGTLVTTRSGAPFRKTADDWQWIPGRLDRLKKIAKDTHIGIATNQGGVGFGYFKSIDILEELMKLCEQVPIPARGCAYCFTHPTASIGLYQDKTDNRRKPGPGMLWEIMDTFMFPRQPDYCLMVGDRPEDEQAAAGAGCAFAWADEFFAESEP